MARFESLGDFGDKWQQRQLERQEKAKLKAEEKVAKAAEEEVNAVESDEDSEEAEVIMDCRKATMDGYSILLIVVMLSVVLLPYGFVVAILILFVISILLRVMFQGPPVRSLVLNHPDYQLIHTMNNGVDVYGLSTINQKSASLY